MKRNILATLIGIVLIGLLTSCGSSDSGKEQSTNEKGGLAQETETATTKEDASSSTNLNIPDEFPKDFPFPDNITITEVTDDSEGEQKDYSIQFTFDPDMDLDALFTRYSEYADKIGYEPLVEGEQYLTDGIYQYMAMKSMSTSNSFIVTMKPTDGTYGSIDLKYNNE